ncbi:MAG TPA: FtsX-like permease family protein, partial [Anaerolineae bacterium]|nr:FtsX-like permease family protein [Anaerolineae bacterium]
LVIDTLLQWFMGLGLVVGIVALGVIAARSVVERRQQIGMLRAIGFRRGMVQNTFILESSFVAILGIVIGSALGLGHSYNAIEFMAKDIPGLEFVLQWQSVLGIAALSYVASLLTTYLPARQASKVYPAEALRYE